MVSPGKPPTVCAWLPWEVLLPTVGTLSPVYLPNVNFANRTRHHSYLVNSAFWGRFWNLRPYSLRANSRSVIAWRDRNH